MDNCLTISVLGGEREPPKLVPSRLPVSRLTLQRTLEFITFHRIDRVRIRVRIWGAGPVRLGERAHDEMNGPGTGTDTALAESCGCETIYFGRSIPEMCPPARVCASA